jgi:hypothetical protein
VIAEVAAMQSDELIAFVDDLLARASPAIK